MLHGYALVPESATLQKMLCQINSWAIKLDCPLIRPGIKLSLVKLFPPISSFFLFSPGKSLNINTALS